MSKSRFSLVVLLSAALSLPAIAHIERSEPLQSLRQSYFAIVGMTFGPMGDMVKGDIEWNGEQFAAWASDLEAVSRVTVERGFAPGSDKGKTRARPEIWDNKADFEEKLGNFRMEAAKLAEVAATGDRQAIAGQFRETGGACKACHDNYKSRGYLYE
ncbi:MAG: cytochrome c [Luminiphilus sp.]|nr:cytochrome c [Luminiphilus sp.]